MEKAEVDWDCSSSAYGRLVRLVELESTNKGAAKLAERWLWTEMPS